MKKTYVSPEVGINMFDAEDVICVSVPGIANDPKEITTEGVDVGVLDIATNYIW